MAQACINGGGECDGCMACRDEGPVMSCPICGEELWDEDELHYSSVYPDEIVACESCLRTVKAGYVQYHRAG